MRFFRPEVERILKTVATGAVVSALVFPLRWSYQQRQQARTWRAAACAYRLRDVARGTYLALKARHEEEPCTALRRLGIDPDSWQ